MELLESVGRQRRSGRRVAFRRKWRLAGSLPRRFRFLGWRSRCASAGWSRRWWSAGCSRKFRCDGLPAFGQRPEAGCFPARTSGRKRKKCQWNVNKWFRMGFSVVTCGQVALEAWRWLPELWPDGPDGPEVGVSRVRLLPADRRRRWWRLFWFPSGRSVGRMRRLWAWPNRLRKWRTSCGIRAASGRGGKRPWTGSGWMIWMALTLWRVDGYRWILWPGASRMRKAPGRWFRVKWHRKRHRKRHRNWIVQTGGRSSGWALQRSALSALDWARFQHPHRKLCWIPEPPESAIRMEWRTTGWNWQPNRHPYRWQSLPDDGHRPPHRESFRKPEAYCWIPAGGRWIGQGSTPSAWTLESILEPLGNWSSTEANSAKASGFRIPADPIHHSWASARCGIRPGWTKPLCCWWSPEGRAGSDFRRRPDASGWLPEWSIRAAWKFRSWISAAPTSRDIECAAYWTVRNCWWHPGDSASARFRRFRSISNPGSRAEASAYCPPDAAEASNISPLISCPPNRKVPDAPSLADPPQFRPEPVRINQPNSSSIFIFKLEQFHYDSSQILLTTLKNPIELST